MTFPHISDIKRLEIIKITTCLGLICGMLLSTNLWLSDRTYPLTPVLTIFYIASPIDKIFYFLCIITLLFLILSKKFSKLLLLSSLIGIIFFLTDQSRLQPWAYQYFFMLTLLAYLSTGNQTQKILPVFSSLQIIIITIYLWSGLSKLNPQFISTVYPWLIDVPFISSSFQKLLIPGAAIVPITEITIAALLIFRRTRLYGIICALGMHLLILLFLGPLGHNTNHVIWFWNLAMTIFVISLFWNKDNFSFKNRHPIIMTTITFFFILPFLSYFNLWDSALSFELYSGNVNRSAINISQENADKLPSYLKKYLYPKNNQLILNTNAWSGDELNVPVYLEKRVYLNITRKLCNIANNNSVTLNYQQRHKLTFVYSNEKFTCNDL